MKTPVAFVGAGPGSADLITVRGLRELEQADLVVYAGSLVNPTHLKACKQGCVCLDSATMTLEEQVAAMSDAALAGKRVVRLHTGDPALYGAINEQIRELAKKGIHAFIVPGVSSVFAAAAALGCELTAPDVSQSVVMTRTPGRTAMPESEDAAAFARTGATLVFFLSTGNIEKLMQHLQDSGGLSPDTPAAVVYRASWPDERILRGTVSDIADRVQAAGLGRQALILVGRALAEGDSASRLYDQSFSHGYRNQLATEHFEGRCALYTFTERGLIRAREIVSGLGLPAVIFSTRHTDQKDIECIPEKGLDACLAENWSRFAAHIFISATGIAVRKIAPFLQDKTVDPAVLVCPENGSHVISLVSGHLGGANRLARRVARITGGQALVSTATDLNGILAPDDVAAMEHARIMNPEAIRSFNAALLAGTPVAFCGPKAVFERHFADCGLVVYEETPEKVTCPHAILWNCENTLPSGVEHLDITDKAFILGVGCRRGVAPDLLQHTAEAFLKVQGLEANRLAGLATCTLKADEPAILALGSVWNLPVTCFEPEQLDIVPVPNPSERVRERTGTGSVCEAACLLAAGYGTGPAPELYVPKQVLGDMTLALARLPHGYGKDGHQNLPQQAQPLCSRQEFSAPAEQKKAAHLNAACLPTGHCCEARKENSTASVTAEREQGEIIVVGLGSGSPDQITPEVDRALRLCDTVAGYGPYLDFVREQISGKQLIENGMRGEVARCRAALEAARTGRHVCMVCSGDPGILAMAGLLYELRSREAGFRGLPIRVLPGITAASLAAASLGAPLQNGFSLVSLSDLLVPADEVRTNLLAAARSMLPVVLYNPAGRKRRQLLKEALDLFLKERGNVPCAHVKHAGRPQEQKWTGRLADFPADEVDMSTLIIIGGPRTLLEDGVLYEARGYMEKYPEQE